MIVIELLGDGSLGRRIEALHPRPAPPTPPRPGRGQTSLGAFPNEIPLELRLSQRFKADAPLLQPPDRLDEVPQGPTQPVEAPDDQSIAGPEEGEGLHEPFPFGLCSTDRVGEDTVAAGLCEGILLEVEKLLVG